MRFKKMFILWALVSACCFSPATVSGTNLFQPFYYLPFSDGYRGDFGAGRTLSIAYGNYAPFISEKVFHVTTPDGVTRMFAYSDAGDLMYYGSLKGNWFFQPQAPHMFLPAQWEVGKPYQTQLMRDEYQFGSRIGRGSDSLTITVTGPESISVPAGDFNVYRFTILDHWQDAYGATGTSTQVYCLAAGLGWVRLILEGVTYDLASFSGTPPSEAPFMTLQTMGTRVNVDWTRVPGAFGYSLNYAPYPDWSWSGWADMENSTSFEIDLSEGAAFYVYIQARNYFGCGPRSNMEHFVLQSTNPLSVIPSDLTLQVQQSLTSTITGGTAPYSASSSNPSIASASVNGSTLAITGVSAGSATVTVSDTTFQSAIVTAIVSATPIEPPPSPTLVSPQDNAVVTGSSVSFSWQSAARATSYWLQIFRASDWYEMFSQNVGNQTSRTVPGFPDDGSAYYWRVFGINAGGWGEPSELRTFFSNHAFSVTPTSLSLTVGQTGACTISGGTSPYGASWSDSSVATASVSGNTLTVYGVSSGTATVTVWDSASRSATVSVTVSGGTPSTYTNSLGQTFVLLPAGTYTRGSPSNEPGRDSDEPQHQVTLTKSFYMQTTEVTQAQWQAVMGSNPSYFSGCPNCPVETVSWNDAQDFIARMNQRGEGTYRLPTEAEWEYAARAGSTTAFANGGITKLYCNRDPNLDAMGWYCYNSDYKTHPVAQKAANVWGLYDMHGNVWEWCQDWYGTYPSGSVTDPTGPSSGSYRVDRGGSWSFLARYCRSAYRSNDTPDNRSRYLGLRLARTP